MSAFEWHSSLRMTLLPLPTLPMNRVVEPDQAYRLLVCEPSREDNCADSTGMDVRWFIAVRRQDLAFPIFMLVLKKGPRSMIVAPVWSRRWWTCLGDEKTGFKVYLDRIIPIFWTKCGYKLSPYDWRDSYRSHRFGIQTLHKTSVIVFVYLMTSLRVSAVFSTPSGKQKRV